MEGEKIACSSVPALHGTAPNDLAQFAYIDMGEISSDDIYILMVCDDLSAYKWFLSFTDTAAENSTGAIIEWAAALGAPISLMSDGLTHFCYRTMRLVSKGLKVLHHFTLSYCPRSNKVIERLGKQLLRTFRVITSECRIQFDE